MKFVIRGSMVPSDTVNRVNTNSCLSSKKHSTIPSESVQPDFGRPIQSVSCQIIVVVLLLETLLSYRSQSILPRYAQPLHIVGGWN